MSRKHRQSRPWRGLPKVALDPRIIIQGGGRQAGKTQLARIRLERTGERLPGPDVALEPLGAGVSRILSRGLAQPVRYTRGG